MGKPPVETSAVKKVWDIRIDGKPIAHIGTDVLLPIFNTFVAQTDFSSQDSFAALSAVSDQIWSLAHDTEFEFEPNFFDPQSGLVKQVQAEASVLSALGNSSVNSQGVCNQSNYALLVGKLENWSLGSSAYYYDLPKAISDRVTRDTRDATQGIRQKLRHELLKTVTPFCEPQSAHSRVEFLLND